MPNHKLVDLEVERWMVDRPMSMLVQINGKRVWLAKSQCEFYEDEGIVTMPEWMAIEKELV